MRAGRRNVDPEGEEDDGPEGSSRRPPCGHHPRLEVELVLAEGVLEVPPSRTSRSANTSTASSRMPGLSDIHIRKDSQKITIDIYTARPGIVIGKSGLRGRRAAQHIYAMYRPPVQININEIKRPELDAKLMAQSVAEQLQNRVSFRRAMKRSLASAVRSGAHGRQGQVRRPPRRHGDVADGAVLGGPRAAPHAPRRHRLRLHRGQDDLRPHRREGLDQQGRDHARGLRGLRRRRRAARRGRCPAAPQRRPRRDHGGARAHASAAPRPARPAGRRSRWRRRSAAIAAAAASGGGAAAGPRGQERPPLTQPGRPRPPGAPGAPGAGRARRPGTERRPGRRSARQPTPRPTTAGES